MIPLSKFRTLTKVFIKSVLTDKQRQTILKIKWESEQRKETFMGIDIYQAVIGEGIETFEDFKAWHTNREKVAISLWEPETQKI